MPPTVPHTDLMNMQQTARLTPLMEHDAVCGTLTLIEDVTERIAAEEELRKQAERLEEANRHKDEFLAMLAHELRNPLAPIRNGIRLLGLVEARTPEAVQTREMMERQVSHMARLVDDLLDVSRIARGKVRLRRELCDLNAIVRNVLDDYHAIVEQNGFRLTTRVGTEACMIRGDSVRLAQILANLLHNATKFTDPGGEITVVSELDRNAQTVTVRVSDTGIGMSRETLSRIFDPFSQADSSLDRNKGGLGLGLSLAKGLADLHGGRIEAFSEGLNRGSTFTLQFPLIDGAPAASSSQPPAEKLASRPTRILVIEDNRDTASTIKALLNYQGYEVQWAATGPPRRRARPSVSTGRRAVRYRTARHERL
jgi:signal transduction histidine kinase